ncbi:hypothetical protein [Synechococcus sp. A15-60]|uniref:hypothetical protein n=1 Tax=Synechococcus sp. A15-60 TaxID=1050655 RepID=UPI0016475256|nr:hypothetical protein [Synechococcus sp. A15-60]QNI48865.1 helix-turn-helix domain protein [Synechococcus sp. A15-60]
MSDATQALLLAEVQQLKADVQTLLQRVPNHQRKWISPTELAQRANCSVRTIANWRETGVIKPASYRPGGRSFEFHADLALADIDARQG